MTQVNPSSYIALTNQHDPDRHDGLFIERSSNDLVLVMNGSVVQRWTSGTGTIADGLVASDARGDLLRRGASTWERLAAASSGQVVMGDGTDVVSLAISGDVALSGAGAATVTDLTIASEARGDILRRNASAWGRLSAKDSGKVLIGDGTDIVSAALSGDVTVNGSGVTAIGSEKVTNAMLSKPRLRCVSEALTAASLTDGGAAIGTKNLTAAIPAGARFLFTTIDTIVGFAGDVSAVITLGDGSDVDRYNTGTPNIFATAAAGVDMGVPSGTAFHATAVANIVATVTSNADITPVLAGGGSCNLKFWFLEPV